jgi:hypothetical protein
LAHELLRVGGDDVGPPSSASVGGSVNSALGISGADRRDARDATATSSPSFGFALMLSMLDDDRDAVSLENKLGRLPDLGLSSGSRSASEKAGRAVSLISNTVISFRQMPTSFDWSGVALEPVQLNR